MYFDPVVLSRSQEEFTFIQIGSGHTVMRSLLEPISCHDILILSDFVLKVHAKTTRKII